MLTLLSVLALLFSSGGTPGGSSAAGTELAKVGDIEYGGELLVVAQGGGDAFACNHALPSVNRDPARAPLFAPIAGAVAARSGRAGAVAGRSFHGGGLRPRRGG